MYSLNYQGDVISENELMSELKIILNSPGVANRDINFIKSITEKLPKYSNLTKGQEKYVKDILMKYSKNYGIKRRVVIIEVTNEIINWAKKEIEEFEKTQLGNWRYEGVNAWRGIVGEKLTFNWLKSLFPDIISNEDISKGSWFDKFDCEIHGEKIDIKCATEWMHASITPKVNTVILWKKDYYIGCKYDERTEPNKLHIMGWLTSEELKKYPILKDKGTDYYEVPINELKDIDLLMDKLKKIQGCNE